MRAGDNPQRGNEITENLYSHNIIVPVYIPDTGDYYKDGFRIFKLCLESLFKTTHSKTFITVVNNGSCTQVIEYLDALLQQKKIHELTHTVNIGKVNAIIKALAGNNIELVTITDADIMFLDNWQVETQKVFSAYPKVGVVGLIPQFRTYKAHCGNMIFDTLFSRKVKFIPVKNPTAMARFYESIGWDTNYNHDYLKYALGLRSKEVTVYAGSGHAVATYKKNMFEEIKSYSGFKLGGNSMRYLDQIPMERGYWRVTTYENYAHHMGNVFEEWMDNIEYTMESEHISANFKKQQKVASWVWYLKNKIFLKVLSIPWVTKLLLRLKGLPKEMISQY